jgi:hypothetical protein
LEVSRKRLFYFLADSCLRDSYDDWFSDTRVLLIHSYSCVALLPALLATAGIASSILSSLGCETIKLAPNGQEAPYFEKLTNQVRDILSDSDAFDTLRFGIFSYSQIEDVTKETEGGSVFRVTRRCVEYERGLKVDKAWKAARAFAIIAPVAAGVLTINLYMAPCCIFYTRTTWSILAFLFILVIPGLQCFTLLFLISNACTKNPAVQKQIKSAAYSLNYLLPPISNTTRTNGIDWLNPWVFDPKNPTNAHTSSALWSIYKSKTCEMDWGYYTIVVSMILFCYTGIAMMIMGAPTRPPPKVQKLHQTVTHQQTTNEQGDPVVEEVNMDVTKVTVVEEGANGAPT